MPPSDEIEVEEEEEENEEEVVESMPINWLAATQHVILLPLISTHFPFVHRTVRMCLECISCCEQSIIYVWSIMKGEENKH